MKRLNIQVFLWLGILSVALGFGISHIKQSFDSVTVALIVLGVLSGLIVLSRLREGKGKYSLGVQFKSRLCQFFYLFVLLVLLVEVNYLAHVYNTRIDVTLHKQHTLSDKTKSILSELDRDIKLTAFHVGLPPKYLEDLLNEYKRLSRGLITIEIIDPIVQLGYASQFGSVIQGKEKKIFIQSEKERRDVDFTDSPLTEDQVTNEILRIMRPQKKAYFLSGHREYGLNDESEKGLTIFKALLENNNFKSYSLMLPQIMKIPEDCDVLVIAGPREHLSDAEKDIIQKYLKRGGDALFLIENVIVTTPDKPLTEDELSKNPSLNSILNYWGIHINDDIVVDLESHAGKDVGSPATRNYMRHKAIIKDLDYTFYVRPRSISLLPQRRKSLKAAPFVLTTSAKNSWGETNRTLNVKYDEGVDKAAPVPLSYVIWEPVYGRKKSDTRIIVFTDADFISNAYISHYTNAQLGLNIINWVSELDYQVFVGEEHLEVEELNLTSLQKRWLLVVLMIPPVLILLCGLSMWIKLSE